jgi:hypothetical protein
MEQQQRPLYEQFNPEVALFNLAYQGDASQFTAQPGDPLQQDADRRVAALLREGAL